MVKKKEPKSDLLTLLQKQFANAKTGKDLKAAVWATPPDLRPLLRKEREAAKKRVLERSALTFERESQLPLLMPDMAGTLATVVGSGDFIWDGSHWNRAGQPVVGEERRVGDHLLTWNGEEWLLATDVFAKSEVKSYSVKNDEPVDGERCDAKNEGTLRCMLMKGHKGPHYDTKQGFWGWSKTSTHDSVDQPDTVAEWKVGRPDRPHNDAGQGARVYFDRRKDAKLGDICIEGSPVDGVKLLMFTEKGWETGEPTPHDSVNHPPHYTSHPSGIECIQITEHMNFNVGNAMKYLWRADEKNAPIEDLKKARWYIDREIARRERAGAK